MDTVDARAFFQCSKITVYCEAASKPGGWSSLWDSFCHAVVWGYGAGPQNLKYEITSSNTVKVVRASVYDAMGRLVGRDAINRVRTEIRVKVAGIYIVKVGNVVKRVMVND